MTQNQDVEKASPVQTDNSKLTYARTSYRLYVTNFNEILAYQYRGEGTIEKPYIVDWISGDGENPQTWKEPYKWLLTTFVSIATLAIAFCSSAYVGDVNGLIQEFHSSIEVVTSGISLFVLGFAIGPLLWAPFSEVLGRRLLFIITYSALTAFNAGTAGSQNMWTVLILRFFAGAFGSSPLTNAGGTIADMFAAKQRGLAMTLFATAPFLGPALGPVVGGYAGESVGWRWVEGIMAIFTGVICITGATLYPETYAPVLLRQRAEKLSKATGLIYRSKFEEKNQIKLVHLLKTSLSRPWVLLFREPIVLFLSIYMAIIYGILYMLFGAFPIVYEEKRKWSSGQSGLAFLGIAVGFMIAAVYCVWDNRRYGRVVDAHVGRPIPPEARLPPAIVGSFALPIGLFWFAWTNYPTINYLASIAAGVPFGFGMMLVFLSLMNYLIDAYLMYAASVLAANSVLRSLFGAVFPLFTTQMFHNIGIHWAVTIPGFLAVLCLPMPYLFWKYGETIRSWSKYSSEATAFVKIRSKSVAQKPEDTTEAPAATGFAEEDADVEEVQAATGFAEEDADVEEVQAATGFAEEDADVEEVQAVERF